MKHVVKTEEEWHALRKQCITASEAAVLVGADPYSSPAKIRKPSEFRGNAFTAVGQLLEYAVVDVTNQILGTKFELFEQNKDEKAFYTSGQLGATPDAHDSYKTLLECKTTRPKTYLKYSSVPPNKYLIQVMVQMICTDIKQGYLSIMSTDLTQPTATLRWPISIFKVLYNEEICTILKEQAERFQQDEKFRVDSAIKKKVQLLLAMSYERIV